MAVTARVQGCLRSNLWKRCHLPLAKSLPSFVGITKIDLKKSANCYFRPYNGGHFPRSRSFEVKSTDKVPLTPSYVPSTFRWNKKNRVGKKCKNAISDPKNGRHFPSSRLFGSNSQIMCPLPLAMSLPSFVGITKIDWEKSAKMRFLKI